ncbi:hypothetical protein FHR92_003536 [Fontibacillus solani]|uniref:Uncharacterized protein n=1 Tax=Fontibacillus solani TaxID=1572857 RepID=A0A7W3SVK6_9BACL|nr:hypothetical protein [Fontibacillus solani]MBA9087056.1 hypothetical protein [Fontibacillus solani]
MPSNRELENLALAKEVKRRYDKRNGILGYRQMRIQLNRKLKKSYNRILLILNRKTTSAPCLLTFLISTAPVNSKWFI